jgi:hypothetical protein
MKAKIEVHTKGCMSGIGVSLEGDDAAILSAVFCRLDVVRLPLFMESSVENTDFPICEDGYVYMASNSELDVQLLPGYSQVDYRGFGSLQLPSAMLLTILAKVASIYLEKGDSASLLPLSLPIGWIARLKQANEVLEKVILTELHQGKLHVNRKDESASLAYEVDFIGTEGFSEFRYIADYLSVIRRTCASVISNREKGLRSDGAEISHWRVEFVQAMQDSGRWGNPVSAFLLACTNGSDDPFHKGLSSYSQLVKYAASSERAIVLGISTPLDEVPIAFDWFFRIQSLGLDEKSSFRLTAEIETAFAQDGPAWESEIEIFIGGFELEILLGEIAKGRRGLIGVVG